MAAPTASVSPRDDQGRDEWRDAVRAYLPTGGPTTAQPATPQPEHDRTALGLQFELRELIPRTLSRWNGPVSTSATARPGPLGDGHRLGIRPVARTARGWARSGITWTNVPHQINRLNLDPHQHRWFCELGALDRALKSTAPGRDLDWIVLDDFANPVLWAMLEQTETLGIHLVGVGSGAVVRRAARATVTLDMTRTSAGLLLEPLLTVDDTPARIAHARSIGHHGIYVVDPAAPRHIVLAPAVETLSDDDLALLANSVPAAVPEPAIAEFMAGYLPDLHERVELSSSDASVSIPPPTPPLLIASVAYGPRHTITLTWRWQQGRRRAPLPPLADLLPPGVLPAEWLGDGASPNTTPPSTTLRGVQAAEFAATTLPRLAGVPGVRVESQGTAPDYRELTGPPHIVVTAVPSERNDWFDLAVTVTVDGRTIPFVPLFKALVKGRRRLLLIDGSYLALNHPSLKALADLIAESQDLEEWEPVPSISIHQLSLWSDFEDLADEAVPAVGWRALLADARLDSRAPVPLPAGLTGTLRPYQLDGFRWLAYLWRHQLGGILADDMGLGKTVQCLALMQHAVSTTAERRPFLIVTPTSVVANWLSEAKLFTPGLSVRTVASTQAVGRVLADVARGADIVVTSYALLRLDFDAYQAVARSTGWAGMVLDEAQFVKNPASKVHAAALDLEVRFKLAVTGTPLENSLTDLQALFAIVAPGLFASAPRFFNNYVRPIEQSRPGIARGVGAGNAVAVNAAVRAERLGTLRRRIRPFLLRRTKELVAAELPAKQNQTLRIALAPEHRELYDLFLQRERQKLFRLLGDLQKNKFIVFRSLTLLRLLALDASLIGDQYADIASSKLDALMEQLDDVVAGGHRALVFSQFTSYLAKVGRRLDAAGIESAFLDGSTHHRGDVVDGFKTGLAPVFLISLKAGGFGLNLTEADYVFLLDPWWNPASEEQAIDRTHRIGQTKKVMVYRLVAADTIEEKVLALQQRKASLFDAVIDDEALFSAPLTAEDIRGLLR